MEEVKKLKEMVVEIQSKLDYLQTEINKNTKASHQRTRKASVELCNLLKEYRSLSVKVDKIKKPKGEQKWK